MRNLIIRNELESDYKAVEILTREAFWNVNTPGCNEHYLVHVLRTHEDYIPELDFVAEIDGEIVGHIIYSKAKLVDANGNTKNILTFGPLSVLPSYQRKGIGKALLNHSFTKALAMGYDMIVIFGHPSNYIARGFKSCQKYNIYSPLIFISSITLFNRRTTINIKLLLTCLIGFYFWCK